MGAAATVVFVHGLWMTGLEFFRLRRHVARAGFATHRFGYRSITRPLADNASRLAAFVGALAPAPVHLVGHSLGGLVILRMLRDHPQVAVGRVVLLGSPVRGSVVARRLVARPWSRWLIGAAADDALAPAAPVDWQPRAPIGVVVGTREVGVGRVLGGVPSPSDGTVAVAETELPGAADTVHVPATHTTLPMSAEVARQVLAFLGAGRFAR